MKAGADFYLFLNSHLTEPQSVCSKLMSYLFADFHLTEVISFIHLTP